MKIYSTENVNIKLTSYYNYNTHDRYQIYYMVIGSEYDSYVENTYKI